MFEACVRVLSCCTGEGGGGGEVHGEITRHTKARSGTPEIAFCFVLFSSWYCYDRNGPASSKCHGVYQSYTLLSKPTGLYLDTGTLLHAESFNLGTAVWCCLDQCRRDRSWLKQPVAVPCFGLYRIVLLLCYM